MASRILLRAILSTATVTATTTTAAYHYDPGTKRSLKFWSQAFPMYARYRYVQFLEEWDLIDRVEADRRYEVLHEECAPKVEQLTLELRGFYLKQAQLMSTRDEFVPQQYMPFLKRMQGEVPTQFKRTQLF